MLIFNLQGPRVEEKINFDDSMSFLSKKIIKFCEKQAFKNAEKVYFPSLGAYNYYCKSKYRSIEPNDFKVGPVLYNTLYAYPNPDKVDELYPDQSTITFLSIGQLSVAKGIDQHSLLLREILKDSTKPLRYIIVGDGKLQRKIHKDLCQLKKDFPSFTYIHIKQCSYPQIQFLQDISDVYLMLHRISIFDLATLEVMNKSKTIILSNIGGNKEFNIMNNIFLWDKDKNKNVAQSFLHADMKKVGEMNKIIYDKYFSNEIFIKNYHHIIDDLIKQ